MYKKNSKKKKAGALECKGIKKGSQLFRPEATIILRRGRSSLHCLLEGETFRSDSLRSETVVASKMLFPFFHDVPLGTILND